MDYFNQVNVTGLSNEQKMFRESLMQEANAYMVKISKRTPIAQDDHLEVHIKTHTASSGKQHRYEIKAHLKLAGVVYTSTNDHGEHRKESWELSLAFKETLEELFKQVDRNAKKPAMQAKRDSDLKKQPETDDE